MPRYCGVSQETGLTVIRASTSYREVLNVARSVARVLVGNIVIMNMDDDVPVMIVTPDGRTVSPNKHHKSP